MILIDKLNSFIKYLYQKLFEINDSPGKIALGFGLGVFAGVMPGVGPVAAIALAYVFRANRASALLGSVLLNTWLSFITFLLAARIGSYVLGYSYQEIKTISLEIIKDFQWEKLFQASVQNILLPVGVGYLIISLILAVITGAIVFVIVCRLRAKV